MANLQTLLNAKTIGKVNFDKWSKNAGLTGAAKENAYFSVLPQHQRNVNIASGWLDWQKQILDIARGNTKEQMRREASIRVGDQSLMRSILTYHLHHTTKLR